MTIITDFKITFTVCNLNSPFACDIKPKKIHVFFFAAALKIQQHTAAECI